jgi:hypothetical protein
MPPPVRKDLGGPFAARADDRQTRGERLYIDETKRLFPYGRRAEHVGLPKEIA